MMKAGHVVWWWRFQQEVYVNMLKEAVRYGQLYVATYLVEKLKVPVTQEMV